MELVSVIVPIYNAETTLKRCIDAILNQSYANIELCLINDGSTDSSNEICLSYQQADNRVHLFQTNGGVSTARNTGIENACGKFIMFCDSDDYPSPYWCEELVKTYMQDNSVLPICNYACFHENDAAPNNIGNISGTFPWKDFLKLYQVGLLGTPWNKLFLKSVIDDKKIRFREDISLGEDLVFVLDYCTAAKCSFRVLNEPHYYYAVGNQTSLSLKYYDNLYDIYKVIFEQLRQTMRRNPESEADNGIFWHSYFFAIDRVFRNTWSDSNEISFISKYRYNRKIYHSDQFQQCISQIHKGDINTIQFLCLKTNSFIVYWTSVFFTEWLSKVKRWLRGANK